MERWIHAASDCGNLINSDIMSYHGIIVSWFSVNSGYSTVTTQRIWYHAFFIVVSCWGVSWFLSDTSWNIMPSNCPFALVMLEYSLEYFYLSSWPSGKMHLFWQNPSISHRQKWFMLKKSYHTGKSKITSIISLIFSLSRRMVFS